MSAMHTKVCKTDLRLFLPSTENPQGLCLSRILMSPASAIVQIAISSS